MAHFAEIDENGFVLNVIVIDNNDAPDPAPFISESLGQAFIAAEPPTGLGKTGTWVQTSYHGNFRKQYASKGYRYDAEADVFILPQPYPSWTLDSNYDWQPPIPYPVDGSEYEWDESAQEWVTPTNIGFAPEE